VTGSTAAIALRIGGIAYDRIGALEWCVVDNADAGATALSRNALHYFRPRDSQLDMTELTACPQAPQLVLLVARSKHLPPQFVSPAVEQTLAVAVAYAVTVGVGAVEVNCVIPTQEQALL
jgi:hypothetical protein